MPDALGGCRPRLAVLGGSSPFTAALVDALSGTGIAIPPQQLVLQGRNLGNALLVQRYARHRLEPLGWSVVVEERLDRAIQGAWLIVHQNRYGGTEGRCEDEDVALRFGIEPDETLGPAALNGFLRTLPSLRETASILAAQPDVWVLNLTNPLSLTTSVLASSGISRCLGLCELPLVTARRAAARLGLPFEGIEWDYAGFNHRGFIVKLRTGQVDRIPELAALVGAGEFEGVPGTEIERLGVIPTKYFALLNGQRVSGGGRGAAIGALRERALRELEQDPCRFPPSLRERYMEWYPQSVVPVISALCAERESEHVVNLTAADGLTREVHATLSRAGVRLRPRPEPVWEIASHLAAFEVHERAVLEWTRDPRRDTLARALELDPLVPPGKAAPVAEFLWSRAD